MEDVAPTLDRDEMEDIWCTSPETPQPAASAAPPCSTPESNGASKRAVACVEASKKGRRNRSPYWDYFDKFVVDGLQKAVCKYCSRQVGCDPRSGTSVLKNHIERCKGYPPKLIPHEQCAALPISALEKLPATRTLYQMMETMDSRTLTSGSSVEGNGGYRTGRAPWAIKESEFSYKIRFDMPGMTRNDVKVWVEDNMLAVEAEKDEGKYKGRIKLPDTVNVDNVKAEVKDGVLYITIPKARAVTKKRIDINVQ
ncbi:hypothetical protein V2J09_019874 [Rumex salicifolius]